MKQQVNETDEAYGLVYAVHARVQIQLGQFSCQQVANTFGSLRVPEREENKVTKNAMEENDL